MSRIGNKIIEIPTNVEIKKEGSNIIVKGPKGELSRRFSPEIIIKTKENYVSFVRPNNSKKMKMLHGTTRANFNNMILGVTVGFSKGLELIGVGYRAQLKGSKLILNVGYSHPVELLAPDDISITVPTISSINIKGINKEIVGEFAAKIRKIRPPEPYKGKGIRYVNEIIRRKEGKTGK